jgi:protein-S-isoprenylcysteine O-methyltransferase Ste14
MSDTHRFLARVRAAGLTTGDVTMIGKLVDTLVQISRKPRSITYKIGAVVIGLTVFAAAAPALLYMCAYGIEKYVLTPEWRSVELVLAWAGICAGVLLLAWSLLTLVLVGRGTPTQVAPPQKLIISGPYRLCRNPIQLGAMTYYFGIGALFGSIPIAVIMFLLALVLGGVYHKFVEEKELRARFGQEYEEYKAKTPFLIPKF